ncbi:DUF3164 family protein [Thalassococcus sp. S3]|uniref:DUF3164 family protein n=1 Tax=Thalassococcus sp. S3 TaxID=2017482 RepID=UPI00102412A5|nr:DUF3164 family protein [Thalassococcus sp. S3]QBF31528.1 hypothetical protein CFI11_09910 [Thalassococcus sp. S3]
MTLPKQVDDGIHEIDGKRYMGDGRGGWQPEELIKPQHKLEDETVRKVLGYALELSDRIRRFLEHTFDDIGDYEAILAQEYGTTKGGTKGNKTFMTVDQPYKLEVRVADRVDFGPELAEAKKLIDECLNEWAAESRAEVRALVTNAFNTEKSGQINRSEIFMLLRLDIEDARWQRAMEAIRDAMRTVGSKTYVRAYHRESFDGQWRAVPLDIAKMGATS